MDYQHEHQSVHLVVYHLIWCAKRRRKVLNGPVHDRLVAILHAVAEAHHWQIIRLAVQPDHVHLFLRANPSTLPTDIPRLMKGRRAHDVRAEFPHLRRLPSLWTRSYFISTAGNVSQETMRRSIEAQSRQ
jgi:putative transposase